MDQRESYKGKILYKLNMKTELFTFVGCNLSSTQREMYNTKRCVREKTKLPIEEKRRVNQIQKKEMDKIFFKCRDEH